MKWISICVFIILMSIAAFIIYGISLWPINDDLVPFMKEIDWIKEGLYRIKFNAILSLIVSIFIYLPIKWMFVLIANDTSTIFSEKLFITSAGILIMVSVICGICFMISKPKI